MIYKRPKNSKQVARDIIISRQQEASITNNKRTRYKIINISRDNIYI